MNQTIWAVQDFIRDEVVKENVQIMHLSQNAITHIKKTMTVGRKILIQFLGKQWANRIETALELRRLDVCF